MPSEHSHLEVPQKRFLNKLRLVLLNNDYASEESNFEKFIDNMMLFVYDHMGFDDGKRLIMRPCNLKLHIGDNSYAAHTDLEGRIGNEVIWVLCEDKHIESKSYKKGELQLICSMIAAYQYNYNSFYGTVHPQKILGTRVVADRFHFYCIEAPSDYIDSLFDGLPDVKLYVTKFPSSNEGLSIANPDSRKNILRYLHLIRNYALSL